MKSPPRNVFSIDVEDWFHILDSDKVPKFCDWDSQVSIVSRNFLRLLDILDESNVKATCFFLGWVAKKYPDLVHEAVRRGHEVASHGFKHTLIFDQNSDDFRADISYAKKLLEDISGKKVLGYRAPGFSISNKNAWALNVIREAGYEYDSSLFPAVRGHGGIDTPNKAPHVIQTESGKLFEFPITIDTTLGTDLCYFGGGYLRLFPYPLIKNRARKISREGRPILFYIHPRDIDPDQPRIDLGLYRNFKCYVNLKTMAFKLKKILSDFHFLTFSEMIDEYDWHQSR
jgi:polysaccharide deacetylase family protein (PEP-CTERM system associated)